MNKKYYQVRLSSENKEDAKDMLNFLTNRKLIVGWTILNWPSHFWWKWEEIDMDYCYIMCFTTDDRRHDLQNCYVEISREEVPMATFVEMDWNKEFLEYITNSIHKK